MALDDTIVAVKWDTIFDGAWSYLAEGEVSTSAETWCVCVLHKPHLFSINTQEKWSGQSQSSSRSADAAYGLVYNYIVSVSSQPEAINFSMGIDATKRWNRNRSYSSVS